MGTTTKLLVGLLLSIGLLFVTTCKDSSTGTIEPDPPPEPTNQPPDVSLTLSPSSGVEPLDVQVQASYEDPDDNFEYYRIDFGLGNGWEEIHTQQIDTMLTYSEDAQVKVVAVDSEQAESEEMSRNIRVTPVYELTLKLRNLTQDGEPFVTTGQTTFTIGEEEYTVDGGQITRTVAEGSHEIHATHPGFYDEWTFIREEGMSLIQMPIEQRDTKDTSSPVEITEDVTLELYKSNRDDLESLSKPYGDAVTGRDFYNMEDVGLVLDRRQEPGTERYILEEGEQITVWINTEESNSQPTQEIKDTIEEWVTTESGASAYAFTQACLGPHNMSIKEGGSKPNGYYIEIIYDNTISDDGRSGETLDEKNMNKIAYSGVTLNPDKADRGVTFEEFTQTIGARRDIINRLEPDLTGKHSNEYADQYGAFGIILGKFLYTVPEGTNYKPEGVIW